MSRSDPPGPTTQPPWLPPKELAKRWGVARSTVGRIARRAGFTRLVLSDGRNGCVRYSREEVEAYEKSRQIKLTGD